MTAANRRSPSTSPTIAPESRPPDSGRSTDFGLLTAGEGITGGWGGLVGSVTSVVVVIPILSPLAVSSMVFFTKVIIGVSTMSVVLLIDILLVSVMTEGETEVTRGSVGELVWTTLDDG